MEATAKGTQFAMYHIEWWGPIEGKDILFMALGAIGATDGCHVYNPEALDYVPEDGEVDLFFSVAVPSMDAYMDGVDAIRAAGLRVKEAMWLGHNKEAATDLSAVWRLWDECTKKW